jgi:hypothetical protein
MLKPSTWARQALAGLVISCVAGCATFEHVKPPPAQQAQIAIRVSNVDSAAWSDGTLGMYRVSDSQVIVGCQEGSAAAVLMFGLLGAAANAAVANANSATMMQGNEASLRLRVDKQIASILEREISSRNLGSRLTLANEQGNPTLLLTPAVMLCATSQTIVRPFVLLQAELRSGSGESIWKTRYAASTGESRLLTGPMSWTSEDGAALKGVVTLAIELLAQVILTDINAPFKRDDASQVIVEAPFPYSRRRWRLAGYKLAEDEKYLTFAPKVGDRFFLSGVYVIGKAVSTNRPKREGDYGIDVAPEEGPPVGSSDASR